MKRNCDNCYFNCGIRWINKFCAFEEKRPSQEICQHHSYKCKCGGAAEYLDEDGSKLCSDCLLAHYNVQTYRVEQYFTEDYDYLGDDDNFDGVIESLNEEIKCLDDLDWEE